MRVIAGKAKSLPLRSIESLETRPTTDRIKETLFNMLQPYLGDCRFLDLFAGSGAIGIEALSRGAAEAVFVENNRRAYDCVRQNLSFTKLDKDARVLFTDAVSAIRKLDREPPFSIIFLDPPYNKGLEREVLAALQYSSLVDEDTLLVLETSLQNEAEWLSEYGFTLEKEKKYKTNKHLFIGYTGE